MTTPEGFEPTVPDELIADYEQRLAKARDQSEQMQHELQGVEVTERSASGVTVTVDATGKPKHIEVNDALAGRGGKAVSTEIMRALGTAQTKIANRVEETMQPYLGGTEAMQRTVEALRGAHPGSVSPGSTGAAEPHQTNRHRKPDRDADEDFGGSIMERNDW